MFKGSAVTRMMATLALAGGIAAGAHASSLTITPLAVKLNDSTRSATLKVTNHSAQARVIQVELVRWKQHYGVDAQTPSDDLLVNPPLATVEPGHSQTIRIGLPGRAGTARERAYRLYVTEVPPPSDHFRGLHIVLRLGVPVYVAPSASASATAHWTAAWAPNGEVVVLTLQNDGNRHLRINGFKIIDPGTGRVLGRSPQLSVTLLAGQARRYGLRPPPGWHGGKLKLVTRTADGGSSEDSVDVAQATVQRTAP